MIVHQAKLQNKQAFLFRLVDIANELFAMASSVSRAQAFRDAGHPEAENAAELADLFCRSSRRRVVRLFQDLWSNDDVRKYKIALKVLDGKHAWLEEGSMGLDRPARELKPATPFKTEDPKPVPILPKTRPVGTH